MLLWLVIVEMVKFQLLEVLLWLLVLFKLRLLPLGSLRLVELVLELMHVRPLELVLELMHVWPLELVLELMHVRFLELVLEWLVLELIDLVKLVLTGPCSPWLLRDWLLGGLRGMGNMEVVEGRWVNSEAWRHVISNEIFRTCFRSRFWLDRRWHDRLWLRACIWKLINNLVALTNSDTDLDSSQSNLSSIDTLVDEPDAEFSIGGASDSEEGRHAGERVIVTAGLASSNDAVIESDLNSALGDGSPGCLDLDLDRLAFKDAESIGEWAIISNEGDGVVSDLGEEVENDVVRVLKSLDLGLEIVKSVHNLT